MYEFSRALMLWDEERTLPDQITQKISELFGAENISFYDLDSDSVSRIGPPDSPLEEAFLRELRGPAKPGVVLNQLRSSRQCG
jgi:hypothetical protein